MLDIKFLRNNPEIVKQNIKNKFQDSKLPLVDEVIALDLRNREIKQEVEALRANKNQISKKIGACMAQGKKEEGGRGGKRSYGGRRSDDGYKGKRGSKDSGRRGGDRSDRTFRKDERDSDRPWKRTAAARDARKKRRF